MIYPYKCDKCGKYDEIACHHTDYQPEVDCDCGGMLERIFTASAVKIPNMDGWNSGLGCRERDTKETIRRVNSKGMDIQELGNDSGKVKQKTNSYKMSRRDVSDMNQKLGWA